jgi:hypothetical protein
VSVLESSVIYLLSHDATVAVLVSDRIYPDYAPIGAQNPCLVVLKISGADVRTADGSTDIADAVIQVGCWADTYAGAVALRAAVKACLNDYVGTTDGVKFWDIGLTNDFDIPIVEPDNEACNEFGRTMDFQVWYQL